jgi:hypothetical protein
MPGDFSRKTFDKKKHYSGVLMQQGRVQLDADWNEELDIEQYRTFTETKDVIGAAGVPKKNNGFKITMSADGSDLVIAPGRIYVAGLLCELEPNGVTSYKNQPYYPSPDVSFFGTLTSPPTSPPGTGLGDGSYIVYLKAWQREINYLDDPYIQEKALGEADTTTRLQTVWQVRLLKVTDPNGTGKCSSTFPEWDALTAPLTGKLNAQTKPPLDNNNPCVLPPSAGYLRLENQLYRVQVQKVDGTKKAQSFKWSRDNASIETTFEVLSDKIIRVADLGKDDVLGFSGNQWVEIVDDISALGGNPNQLAQIDAIDPDSREITLKTSVLSFQSKKNLKLRRWDMGTTATQDGLAVAPGWQDIEDGIQVSFGNGTYEPGDYWLIPARTANGDIEWQRTDPGLLPIPQSRRGTEYYYCRLAFAKVAGGVVTLEDCRDLFPSLTDICAEDICFNNTNCKFPAADNVQEALDILCAANDLRDHNKHLHGYGVVCGLKVICGTDRRFVKVETGYALDCEGNVIRNKSILNFDVIAAATAAGIPLNGKVPVCISIAYNGANAPVLSVEPFVKQSLWDEILEGTLLKDFLDGCIKSLFNALKSELGFPLTQAAPVPIAQRRLTAVINLLSQMINSKSGVEAFLSGKKGVLNNSSMCTGGNVEDKDEHELLYCFYEKLKILLSSETYCGQVEHKVFPEYPLDAGEQTIFGTPLKTHRKLKISPDGNFGYTAGGGHKIHVYDLSTQEFVRWIDFPTSNVQIQDICVSRDGSRLFVVALASNGNDSVFATATLSNPVVWSGPFTSVGNKFTTLARPANTDRLLAIAKAKGLFDISFTSTAVNSVILNPFNSTGLLAVKDEGDFAFAAAASAPVGTEAANFSSIRLMNLNTGQVMNFAQTGTDEDDDLIYYSNSIYYTGKNSTTRVLAGVRQLANSTPVVLQPLTLPDPDSVMRLAAIRQNSDIVDVLITMSDQCKVLYAMHAGANLSLGKIPNIPVQLFPIAIAPNKQNEQMVYVLNTLVNTITAMEVARVLRGTPPNYMSNPNIIPDYRDAMLDAYKGLFMRLLQYLKDCFCDKFLIDCPQCTEKNKVYLGTIEIHDSEIYHICNFSKRKYVKTFRTVGYWLSVIPVANLLKKAFTVFCCAVLDDLNKKP